MFRNVIMLFLLCTVLHLSACGPKPVHTEQDILNKGDELHELAASRTVSVVDEPYLGAASVPLSDVDKALARHVSMSMVGTLGEVCSTAAPLTNLAWQAEGGAEAVRRVRFEGSTEAFCRYLAALFGAEWRYDAATKAIIFAAEGTRTFTLLAAPGKAAYKSQITNQSKDNDTSGGGAFGQAVNASDISSQTAQSNNTDLTVDVWNEALTAIKGLLSKTGTVTANMASGTVTVTDSAPVLRRIGQFVRDFNRKLARQVALEVRVWQLVVEDESEVGLNLEALFVDGKLALSTGMSLDWSRTGAGELNATLTGGRLKGSQATLKALSNFGKTTLVTSGSGVTMNNMPLPVQNTTKDTYLAGMSLNTNDYGQTSQITPGEVTTGFAMTVIPHILDRRTLILQYNASLTSLDAVREYSNSTIKVEMPKVSTRAFSQRVTMRMGQTLVLAGFEHEIHGNDNTLGLLAAGRKGQYERSLIIITISVESMPGYEDSFVTSQISHISPEVGRAA